MKFDLKVIKSLEQYTKYCNLHESLMIDEKEEDLETIELLELLISVYDNEKAKNQKFHPVELFRELIFESWESQAKFSEEINISPQLINDILNYRRAFSRKTAIKVSTFFALKKDAFLYPYDLELGRKRMLEEKSNSHEKRASE